MEKTFKFRFVNEITGVFVLLAVALLIAGIFLAGRAQGLFEKKFKLHTVFTSEEGSFGLKKGSEIKILNATAGAVDKIVPTSDGAIQATFELKDSFHGFVRTSSKAIVKKTLMVAGDSYVEISVGDRKDPVMPDGGTIECVKDTDITQQIMKLVEDIRAETIPALRKIQRVLDELPGLTVQARKTLRQGEILMRDDVPALTMQVQDTLRETQTLIQGLERHWLLRKYIEPMESGPMISPAQTGPVRGETP